MADTQKVTKFVRDPLGVLSRRWSSMTEWLRFRGKRDYRSREYWKYRHTKYGFDLRGVGDKSKSHDENVRLLSEGAGVLLDVCRAARVPLGSAAVLDVGCGTGFFAGVLKEHGVKEYLGVDIVDTLFDGLRSKYPGFRFQQLDVATEPLSGTYDLILAMDVLQHIVDEKKFAVALENIRSHLRPGGTVVISTDIGPYLRRSYYMVRRPMEVFRDAFPGFVVGKPVRYAESLVFSLRMPQHVRRSGHRKRTRRR